MKLLLLFSCLTVSLQLLFLFSGQVDQWWIWIPFPTLIDNFFVFHWVFQWNRKNFGFPSPPPPHFPQARYHSYGNPRSATVDIYFAFFTARKRSLRRLCFHRCLSVHRGRGLSAPLHAGIHTPLPPWDQRQTPPPPGRHPPPQRSACWDTVNKLAVRIPLECILVVHEILNCTCSIRHNR